MKKFTKKVIKNVFGFEVKKAKSSEYKYLTSIYHKYSKFTMVPQQAYIENLQLILNYKDFKGDVVECGVWRGGMIAGIAEILGKDRSYHLFDSFEGLPPAKEIDGTAAITWQSDKDGVNYYDNCTASEDYARNLLDNLKVNYTINKGWFQETFPLFHNYSEISILRLDADWYDSTLLCLEYFFPKVSKGGIIIIDDYYTWEGCSKAVHDYLSREQSNCVIRSGSGFAYITKQ
jgi:hypothetical protein